MKLLKELFSIFYDCEILKEDVSIKISYSKKEESDYMKSIMNGIILYPDRKDNSERRSEKNYRIEYFTNVKKIILRTVLSAEFILENALKYGPCGLRTVKNGFIIAFDEQEAAEAYIERGEGKWLENSF